MADGPLDSDIPNQFDLMWPTVLALRALGGSASNDEILQQVVADEGFTEEQQSIKRRPGDHMSKIEYHLAWARNGLKLIGALENSARGVWALTDHGRSFTDGETLVRAVRRWRSEYNKSYTAGRRDDEGQVPSIGTEALDPSLGDGDVTDWRDVLLDRLLQLSPSGFERLAQRLLREADFRDVQVQGKSGDGGIDGVGDLRISLVSFPVYFQCKRYKDAVGAGAVRDFRGAMSGRGEKGLLITTSTFTREAREEARRDGAPPIELVTGRELAELLKRYEIGVTTTRRIVEEVSIDSEYFGQFD